MCWAFSEDFLFCLVRTQTCSSPWRALKIVRDTPLCYCSLLWNAIQCLHCLVLNNTCTEKPMQSCWWSLSLWLSSCFPHPGSFSSSASDPCLLNSARPPRSSWGPFPHTVVQEVLERRDDHRTHLISFPSRRDHRPMGTIF